VEEKLLVWKKTSSFRGDRIPTTAIDFAARTARLEAAPFHNLAADSKPSRPLRPFKANPSIEFIRKL